MKSILAFVFVPIVALAFPLIEQSNAQESSSGSTSTESTSSSASPQSSGSATDAPTSNPTPEPTATPSGFSEVQPYFELYSNLQNTDANCLVIYPAKNGCSMEESFPGYINWDGSQGMMTFCDAEVDSLPPYWTFGISGCGDELAALSPEAYSKTYPFTTDNVFADRGSSNFLALENRGTRTSQKVSLKKLIEFFQSIFSSPTARKTTRNAIENTATSPVVKQNISGDNTASAIVRQTGDPAKLLEQEAIKRYNEASVRQITKWHGERYGPHGWGNWAIISDRKKLTLKTSDGAFIEGDYIVVIYPGPDGSRQSVAEILGPAPKKAANK